jgi:hypothetical protein
MQGAAREIAWRKTLRGGVRESRKARHHPAL